MLEICVAEMKEVHLCMFVLMLHLGLYHCANQSMQVDKELEQLEQEINPVLGDDPQVALSYLFGKVVEEMKATPDVCTWSCTCTCILGQCYTYMYMYACTFLM